MKINKALVRHEARNMKWMMLYFLLVAIGGILYFNTGLNREYMETLTRGLTQDRNVLLTLVRFSIDMLVLPIGLGILLMIYLQFKDSKSVEVGNFLKSLPISNREYYTTKLVGGLVSLTIPTIVLIAGVLLVRNNNMYWINDIYSISFFPEIMAKGDSILNIISVFVMTYMVAVSTYAFLFAIQYIVMNITAGLVIGSLVWLSPMFILGSIGALYGEFISKIYPLTESRYALVNKVSSYIQPWLYPIEPRDIRFLNDVNYPNATFDNLNIEIMYYEGVVWKIAITFVIAVLSIAIGYTLSNKSKVEDSDAFISFKWARKVFVVGVTVCSGLLVGDILELFLMRFNKVGFIPLNIAMIVGAFIGFIVSRKITSIKAKQGGII